MAVNEAKTIQVEEYQASRNFLLFQILLRLLAGGAALAAVIIMVSNRQISYVFGIAVEAKFSYSESFKFFVAANSLAFVYSLVSVFFMARSSSSKYKILFGLSVFDLATTALLASGCSAATAVAYIAKNGNQHAGWLAICDYMDSYCSRGGISLACSYAAFVVFFLLAATTMKGPRQTTAGSY
ncbi:CASP-like protein 1F1 [Nymphaea thermarum]|nr:CASP-like protein 1F1 [Nymphaea thermarum]